MWSHFQRSVRPVVRAEDQSLVRYPRLPRWSHPPRQPYRMRRRCGLPSFRMGSTEPRHSMRRPADRRPPRTGRRGAGTAARGRRWSAPPPPRPSRWRPPGTRSAPRSRRRYHASAGATGGRENSGVRGAPGFGCPEGSSSEAQRRQRLSRARMLAAGIRRSTLMQWRGWTENTGRGPMRAMLRNSSPARGGGWQAHRLVLGLPSPCMICVSKRARGDAVGGADDARQPTRQGRAISLAGWLDPCGMLRRSLGIGFVWRCFRTGSGRVVRGQRAFAEALSRCGARRVASSFMCLSQEAGIGQSASDGHGLAERRAEASFARWRRSCEGVSGNHR